MKPADLEDAAMASDSTPDSPSNASLPIAAPAPPGSLLAFLSITFAVAWACFLPVASGAVSARSPLGAALVLLGTFAPSLVALGLTARAEGAAGVRSLLSRILQGHVRARWYLFVAGYMAAIKLTVALVHRLATGGWPRFGTVPWYLIPRGDRVLDSGPGG